MVCTRLFVYGTLMPGHLRWPLLEPHASGRSEAAIPGRLWDTGRGRPVARFDRETAGRPAGKVPGWAIELRADRLEPVLAELDIMEGVPEGLYERVLVTLDDGQAAWAYQCLIDTDRLAPIGAWSDQPES